VQVGTALVGSVLSLHLDCMIRILLVDDQAIIREALKVLLEQEQDFQIVGTGENGQVAIDQVAALQPDVLLIDIIMPGMDGVTATQIISQRFPETKTIVLSGQDDEKSLAQALQAGAKGYLLKTTAREDLASTIRSVYRGHSQLGPGLFEKFVATMSASAPPEVALVTATSAGSGLGDVMQARSVQQQIQKLQQLNAACAALSTRLEVLRSGFQRLNRTVKL
jgi:DNA-binding NarL/FixJ family response regulator